MTRHILSAAQVLDTHDHLAGRPTPLGAALAACVPGDTLAVPVRPETVYHVEALFRLAEDSGLKAELMASEGLDPRATEFIADFRHFYLGLDPPSEPNPSTPAEDALALLRHGGGTFLRRIRPAPEPARVTDATLIGAYGGEHVGDAAILGGVLLGLNADYGTREVTLLSKRPEHTRRLVAALETPVRVVVEPYGHADLARAVAAREALVFAGGPLMDLPRMLVMHLKAARLAAAQGKPFIVRNVGVGPFKRRASRIVAREIARLASSFTVRTSEAARDPILDGLDVRIGHDPAFDYLASRADLGRLTAGERAAVDQVLAGTEGRPRIGINIRPIRHEWAKQGVDFARTAEDRFLEHCAASMVRLAETGGPAPIFVFFPMNPIQLGGSDLHSAYRLQKLLAGRAEMRVLQADPDVDGVLYLLRALDGAVTMRFHASIFALSQGLWTAGVDYYPGEGGKVEQLFRDKRLADRVRRMDRADEAWLFTCLSEILATRSVA